MSDTALLQRRLAALRAARAPHPAPRRDNVASPGRKWGAAQAERLAAAVGGEALDGSAGHVVRVEPVTIALPLERPRLASLPGQPPADARLVCLDTETTGLSTAAGTLAFLVGLGWWEGDRFRQVQLLCPDHGDEPALLAAVDAAIPPDAWLVTYNGRGFDWPLLVTRYRLIRRAAPVHAGMLDLLPHVRRLFRHRLGDARLVTVERELLGVRRDGDVGGWEIPERYLAFVHGGSAAPLAPVVTHNAEDVRSLGRLGRPADAAAAWEAIAAVGGPGAAHAWVEVAKVREHALADHVGALAATAAAERATERSRLLGMPDPALEPALARRRRRLGARLRRAGDGARP